MIRHIIITLSLLLPLSGCWGLTELPEVAIVGGVGIDKKDSGEFQVTTQTIQPMAVKENQPEAVIVRTSSGLTVFEAVRDFIITAGKKQLWQHIEALVIGPDIAKEGVIPILDFLHRDHEPRPTMYCFVSKETAQEILEIKSKIESIPTKAMRLALEEQISLAKAPRVEMHNFIERLMQPYQDPYLPIIRKGQEDFEIFGTAIFKKDRMVGELTPRETRAMLRVLGEVEGGLQVIIIPSEEEKRPNYASIEIKSSKADIQAELNGGDPKIKITIDETGVIGDISQHIEIDHQKLKDIEKIYANTIHKEIEHVVQKIQKELQSNALNFAGVIQRKDKHYWKEHKEEWDEIYPRVQVDIQVKTELIHHQLIRDSIFSK